MSCPQIPESQYLAAGWGCCACRTYNGTQRPECKFCGHKNCGALKFNVPPATMRN